MKTIQSLAIGVLASALIGTPQARRYSVLYRFSGSSDGLSPTGDLTRDSAGNLYGTTPFGGSVAGFGGNGVVFKVDPTGKETVLYTFLGGADGSAPSGGVIRDSAGNLYGTAAGGTGGNGVVFTLDPAGNETVLHSFSGPPDGAGPNAGLIRDSAGNLYGTTMFGGVTGGPICADLGCGVVFKLDPAGNETVLYRFSGPPDGFTPQAGLIRDSAGNLYGTASGGGSSAACTNGCGVVFKLDRAGNETVLHSFSGSPDGAGPNAGLIRDSAGNLYGTTLGGGVTVPPVPPPAPQCTNYGGCLCFGGCGTVYKLDPAGHETVLHSFSGPDGFQPLAGVRVVFRLDDGLDDSVGNLVGTTAFGGVTGSACPVFGCGVVFKLDTTGKEVVLHRFTGPDGAESLSGLIHDSAGNLYGTTQFGGFTGGVCAGNFGCGVVFKLHYQNGGEDEVTP
jgi:uncharacterized repeat protein (TIGR03803 family)